MSRTFYGIDLSKHNKVLSWASVYDDNNIDFIILRAGGNYNGFYKDTKFEQYYNACKMYGIPVGAYYDCGKEFFSLNAGLECAKHFRGLLSGKQLEMPVYMDIEVTPSKYKKYITDAASAFCSYMETHKYFVGIYASDISGFKERLDFDRVKQFSTWVARYGKKPEYIESPGMWQYSSSGKVNGIFGPVDLDKTNIDFPKIIKRGCFNGY